jgi:hypothetical protein
MKFDKYKLKSEYTSIYQLDKNYLSSHNLKLLISNIFNIYISGKRFFTKEIKFH